MHSFQHQFSCTSWKGHFISQAEHEMINLGTKPIFKLYGATFYEKGTDTLPAPLFMTNWFRKYHWFKDARGQIFSSKTNQQKLRSNQSKGTEVFSLSMPKSRICSRQEFKQWPAMCVARVTCLACQRAKHAVHASYKCHTWRALFFKLKSNL